MKPLQQDLLSKVNGEKAENGFRYVVNFHLVEVDDPIISQQWTTYQHWSQLNCFCAAHDHCGACRNKWPCLHRLFHDRRPSSVTL